MVKSIESRYKEYISELIPWINENIDKSPAKIIRVKIDDIINKMGPTFKKDVSIYKNKNDSNIRTLFELKYLLWPDEIVVNGTIDKITGESLLTFRKVGPEDESPTPGLTESIGEEGVYYTKTILVDVVTENPFLSDDIITELINTLELPEVIKADSAFEYFESDMSISKIGDWKIVKEEITKGDRVVVSGYGRTSSWGKHVGTVIKRMGSKVYVIWDGTHFEDEMDIKEVRLSKI